jgi:small subunit ribosomal protein S12e
MSDHEGDAQPMDTTPESTEVTPVLPAVPVALTPSEALRIVLKNSLKRGGLARGLRECVKALDRREARLCVLASNCDEQKYKALVRALCNEHDIKLMEVEDSKQLGEWAGLCKLDRDAKPCKIVGASCVVIRDFGEQSDALTYLLGHLKA